MNSPMFFMLQIDFPQALPPPLSTSSLKHPEEHPEEEPMVIDEPSSSKAGCALWRGMTKGYQGANIIIL